MDWQGRVKMASIIFCFVALCALMVFMPATAYAQGVIDPSIAAHVIQPVDAYAVPDMGDGKIVACSDAEDLRMIIDFYYDTGGKGPKIFIGGRADCTLVDRPFLAVGVMLPAPYLANDGVPNAKVPVWIIKVYFLNMQNGLADTGRLYHIASLAELFR